MSIVELAKQAMIELGISPVIEPVRGGTDGSKSLTWYSDAKSICRRRKYARTIRICFFTSNGKATDVIVKIAELNTKS